MTLEQAKKIARQTAGADPTTDAYRVAVILAMSAEVGPDEAAVVKATGEDPAFVATVAGRLRRNRVWTADGKIAADWADPRDGGTAFALDICVGAGMMERAKRARRSLKKSSC